MDEAKRRIQRWIQKQKQRLPLNLSKLGLTELPDLPSNLLHLNCDKNNLKTLTKIPPRLISLRCCKNPLTSLGSLPHTLRYLICTNCPIQHIEHLPPNLHFLDIRYCKYITSIYSLPESLAELYMDGMINLNYIVSFPENLRILHMDGSVDIYELPAFPSKLREISIYYLSIRKLIGLPESLRILAACSCNLDYIESFPKNCKQIYIRCNDNLSNIPTIPDGSYVRVNGTQWVYDFISSLTQTSETLLYRLNEGEWTEGTMNQVPSIREGAVDIQYQNSIIRL